MADRLPPGPRSPKAVQTLGWWTRPITLLERCRARYGGRFTLRMLAIPPAVMFTDPDDARDVLTAPADRVHPGEGARRLLEQLLGAYSVILLDGREHLEQRKLMLPAFHGEKMRALMSLMRDVAEREVAQWPRGEPIALHPRLRNLTLEIILRAVFGLDPGERLDHLRDCVIRELSMHKFINPALQRDFGPYKAWSRFLALREETDALIFDLIDERRRLGSDRPDVLAMLLEARHEDGSPMSRQELRDELMTLLVSGHDTTTGQLAWVFERLMRQPAVLRRLVDEVDSDDGEEYLNATLNEALRHRPVLPVTNARLVKQAVTIGGDTYEPGVFVSAATYLIHHDPEIYPEPYAFRPERWIGEQPGTYTWLPFGGGRRRCLGSTFALAEMRVVLRVVLGANELRAGTDEPFEPATRRGLTITPARGALAVLTSRRGRPAAAEPTLAVA